MKQWWERLIDPLGAAHDAPPLSGASPTSPEGIRRRRLADLRNAPRPGESFEQYARRRPSPDAPAPQDIAPSAMGFVQYQALARQQAAERSRENLRRGVLRADTPQERNERNLRRNENEPPSPARVVGEGAVAEFNRPSMIMQDIPMGVSTALPRIRNPYRTEGRDVATGFTMDSRGRPAALRIGTFRWGSDQRRPMRDVLADVSAATGAPENMLYMIGRRENFPYLELYDRPPAEGGGVSSATGPHQFTAPTWRTWINGLGTMYGVAPSMADEERAGLVDDARFSGAMTAEMARYHASLLQPRIGRAPSIADIYMMHHGGEEAIPLLEAVHTGRGDARSTAFYSPQAVANHPNDFYVNGDKRVPRTAQQFYDWMTGQDDASPHRRDYLVPGRMQGLPTEPVEFGARMDGSSRPARVLRPGVIGLPEDSLLERRTQPLVIDSSKRRSR